MLDTLAVGKLSAFKDTEILLGFQPDNIPSQFPAMVGNANEKMMLCVKQLCSHQVPHVLSPQPKSSDFVLCLKPVQDTGV